MPFHPSFGAVCSHSTRHRLGTKRTFWNVSRYLWTWISGGLSQKINFWMVFLSYLPQSWFFGKGAPIFMFRGTSRHFKMCVLYPNDAWSSEETAPKLGWKSLETRWQSRKFMKIFNPVDFKWCTGTQYGIYIVPVHISYVIWVTSWNRKSFPARAPSGRFRPNPPRSSALLYSSNPVW